MNLNRDITYSQNELNGNKFHLISSYGGAIMMIDIVIGTVILFAIIFMFYRLAKHTSKKTVHHVKTITAMDIIRMHEMKEKKIN